MEPNGSYQMSLIERLSFVRYGGTEEELRAAHILLDEIQAAGGEGELMDFAIPATELHEYSVKVTAPFEKELSVTPYSRSGEIDSDLKLFYAPRGAAEEYGDLEDLSGYVVLLDRFTFDAYKLLCERHASAFLAISGHWYGSEETEDMYMRGLRPHHLKLGKIPGFQIRASDANDILRDGAETLHVTLRQSEVDHTSRDVLAVIPGTSRPQESIVITAHYDSVPVGTGSWDNASGAANVMMLYKHFLKNPPRRTLRFVWCGSEEQGLLGSKAYIEQHEALVKNEIKFCFNFDMCGTTLGNNQIFVTGGDDLKNLAEQYSREQGWHADVQVKVHSSDSAPFADRGIPALGLSRRTPAAMIHTRNDLIGCLSAGAMADMEAFSTGFISRVANAAVLPVPTGMPEEMKKELAKYFFRDRLEAWEKEQKEKAEAQA